MQFYVLNDYDVIMLRPIFSCIEYTKKPVKSMKSIKNDKVRKLRTVLRTARELPANFANCSRAIKTNMVLKKSESGVREQAARE